MQDGKTWSESPVFIIGNPRSGTTMLQLMLTSNPGIFVPTECGFLVFLYEKYKDFSGNTNEIKKFVEDVFCARKIELWNITFEGTLNYLMYKKPKTYKELSSGIYEYYGKCYYPGIYRWGDKNNFYLNHIEDINRIFPSAQYIHIVRDGRDVACSYKDMSPLKNLKYAPNLPDKINEISLHWKNNIEKVRLSFDDIGWGKVIEIRYEDLVNNSTDTLKSVCSFLQLQYSDAMLKFNQNNTEKGLVPKEFEAWKSMNKQEVSTLRINRWKNELTKNEVYLFESIAKDILAQYNYNLEF